MEEDLTKLKTVLKSLVVSSPTRMDVRSLLSDYRTMVGEHLPFGKFGYRDPAQFLRDRCADCFMLSGSSVNPELTLIVSDKIKHIDAMVQKQKIAPHHKFKGKRRSIETNKPPPKQDLIVNTFRARQINNGRPNLPPNTVPQEKKVDPPKVSCYTIENKENKENRVNGLGVAPSGRNIQKNSQQTPLQQRDHPVEDTRGTEGEKSSSTKSDNASASVSARTSSSCDSSKRQRLMNEFKSEIVDLVLSYPEGVMCTDLIRLYRQRYGHEMPLSKLGFTSVLSVACYVSGAAGGEPALAVHRGGCADEWRLMRLDAPAPPTCPIAPRRRWRPAAEPIAPRDPEDALPGVAFDEDVFPAEYMGYMDGVPKLGLEDVAAGSLLEVMVAEVYSPSHFWLIRLGEHYHIAMHKLMDEMNKFYASNEGKEQWLPPGAVNVGHYCSSVYEGDWHRSMIVKIIDSDTVKVRHIDYGTVERVSSRRLRPLRREWAALPAQALRARLAAVRPSWRAAAWPRSAAQAFLARVRDLNLVANVLAVDHQEQILEVVLVDTTEQDDALISEDLISAGHAEPRDDSALMTSESYLFPTWEALESGATPSYTELNTYLRDGIALRYVEDYARHVPLDPPCQPRQTYAPPDDCDPYEDDDEYYTVSSPSCPSTPLLEPHSPPKLDRVPLLTAPNRFTCRTSDTQPISTQTSSPSSSQVNLLSPALSQGIADVTISSPPFCQITTTAQGPSQVMTSPSTPSLTTTSSPAPCRLATMPHSPRLPIPPPVSSQLIPRFPPPRYENSFPTFATPHLRAVPPNMGFRYPPMPPGPLMFSGPQIFPGTQIYPPPATYGVIPQAYTGPPACGTLYPPAAPPPAPSCPPLPEAGSLKPADVTLSASECEIYLELMRVNASLAHRYMADSVARKLSAPAPARAPAPALAPALAPAPAPASAPAPATAPAKSPLNPEAVPFPAPQPSRGRGRTPSHSYSAVGVQTEPLVPSPPTDNLRDPLNSFMVKYNLIDPPPGFRSIRKQQS